MIEKITEIVHQSLDVKCRFFAAHTADVGRVARTIAESLKAGGRIYLFGNGGSASDAQHIAAEFINRFSFDHPPIPALALTTDTSVLTSISNDSAFLHVFSRQIAAFGRRGDVAVGISTSGSSPNVIEGIKQAKQLRMTTVGLLGKDGGQLAALVDHALIVPSNSTARVQEVHIMIGHIICELVEHELYGSIQP
ncbi:MAG: D-sedoheptulose 7-phosphate isomerase [Acidobacteriota bacterium]|nr:D-sedoheptulose 7-phosphate isomerase [Blastocatellia bacterium]MDW8413070.1 D-sedoheptulose 7-phosphate isomerase [Acidobacteriota bacterium]